MIVVKLYIATVCLISIYGCEISPLSSLPYLTHDNNNRFCFLNTIGTCVLHVPTNIRNDHTSSDVWKLRGSYEVWSDVVIYGSMAPIGVLSHRPRSLASGW
jgi:hypothetical protein